MTMISTFTLPARLMNEDINNLEIKIIITRLNCTFFQAYISSVMILHKFGSKLLLCKILACCKKEFLIKIPTHNYSNLGLLKFLIHSFLDFKPKSSNVICNGLCFSTRENMFDEFHSQL